MIDPELVRIMDSFADEGVVPSAEAIDKALNIASASMANAQALLAGAYAIEARHLSAAHTRCTRCYALEGLTRRGEAMIIWHLEDSGTERRRA